MDHGQQFDMQYQQNIGNCNQCGSYTELYNGICRNCKQRLFTVQQIEIFEKQMSCCNQQFMFIKNYRNQKNNLLKICNSTAKTKLTIGIILTVLYLFFCIAFSDFGGIEAIAGLTIMTFPFIGYFYASYYEHSKKKAEANKQLNILEMNYNNALGDW